MVWFGSFCGGGCDDVDVSGIGSGSGCNFCCCCCGGDTVEDNGDGDGLFRYLKSLCGRHFIGSGVLIWYGDSDADIVWALVMHRFAGFGCGILVDDNNVSMSQYDRTAGAVVSISFGNTCLSGCGCSGIRLLSGFVST